MMVCATTGPKATGPSDPWNETSETEPKQYSLFKLILVSYFHHSDEQQTQ
jgi:hypothetical protein